jgi:hypothetical protein
VIGKIVLNTKTVNDELHRFVGDLQKLVDEECNEYKNRQPRIAQILWDLQFLVDEKCIEYKNRQPRIAQILRGFAILG